MTEKYTCLHGYGFGEDSRDLGEDLVRQAVTRCPFLQHVSKARGDQFARKVALNPFVAVQERQKLEVSPSAASPERTPSKAGFEPLFPEDDFGSFQAVMNLVHGPTGCVPLAKNYVYEGTSPLMGSISMSGFQSIPSMAAAMMRKFRQQKGKHRQRHKKHQKRNPTNGGASRGSHVATTTAPKTHVGDVSAGHDRSLGRFLSNPVGGIIALGAGKSLQCPPAIVSMRAAVARIKAVRELRPHALPVRAFALAGAAISLNVPCGMLREHTKKFSPAWMMAVHATIPFVAMLRKAVMMPAWGLGLTVLGSLAGQHMGSVLEHKRLDGTLPTVSISHHLHTLDISKIPRAVVVSLLPEGHPITVC